MRGWKVVRFCGQGLAGLAVEDMQQGRIDAETQSVTGCDLLMVVEAQHQLDAGDSGIDELL